MININNIFDVMGNPYQNAFERKTHGRRGRHRWKYYVENTTHNDLTGNAPKNKNGHFGNDDDDGVEHGEHRSPRKTINTVVVVFRKYYTYIVVM